MKKIIYIFFCLSSLLGMAFNQPYRWDNLDPSHFVSGERKQVFDRVPVNYIPSVPPKYEHWLAYLPPSDETLLPIADFTQFHQDNETVQQYLDLQSLGAIRNLKKTNLCGFLVVRQIVQKPLDQFFRELMKQKEWVADYVKYHNYTLNQYHLLDLISVFPYNARLERVRPTTKQCESKSGPDSDLCVLKEWLKDGYLITLANLDRQTGLVLSYSYQQVSSHIPHWVLVLQVIQGQDGTYIRLYNPYQNREEIYRWEDFYATWRANRDPQKTPELNIVVTPKS